MELELLNLPDDWRIARLDEAFEFTKKPFGMKIRNGQLVPFIPMDRIPIGRLFVEAAEVREKVGSGTYFENGDFLLPKITPSFENGKQAIARLDGDYGYATTEVIPIREREGISDTYFLHYVLLHPEIRADLAGKMDGTTGRQRLRKEVVADRLIPLPPLPEQKKIAHVLSTVQRAIEQQERIIQ
ncbi:MAG: restriction endonuclease subunit S, partial [bacterium]